MGRLEKSVILKTNSKVILDYAHIPSNKNFNYINLRQQFPNKK